MGMTESNSARIVKKVFIYVMKRISSSAPGVEVLFSTSPGEIRELFLIKRLILK